ncbi:hypothetical protein BDC45DRAFT_530543 [Circinella umbellata]|nr:hypothetical protein BDC45DRAFT_530543 [Circinella umbellata]
MLWQLLCITFIKYDAMSFILLSVVADNASKNNEDHEQQESFYVNTNQFSGPRYVRYIFYYVVDDLSLHSPTYTTTYDDIISLNNRSNTCITEPLKMFELEGIIAVRNSSESHFYEMDESSTTHCFNTVTICFWSVTFVLYRYLRACGMGRGSLSLTYFKNDMMI